MPKMVQQTGSGTASSKSIISPNDRPDVAPAAGALVTVTGAIGALASGVASSGCVFVIFTAGAGGGVRSGKMLMRAVSFFGPDCPPAPG